MNINDDLHWFIDGAVIYESKTNRAFLNMTHDEFERRLREIIGMEEVNKPDLEGVVAITNMASHSLTLALVLTLASLSRLQRQITKRPCRIP